MADPFALSVQYQNRLNRSTEAFDQLPDRFMQGMKIPGIIAQNKITQNEAIDSSEKLSANQQLRSMMSDPMGFGKQFGELKSAKEMRGFMANHAAISITPMGERIMQRFDRIATVTEQAEIHSIDKQLELATAKKQAEFMSEAIEAAVDVKNLSELQAYKVQRNKSKSLANFAKEANAAGLNPYSVQFGKDAYDDQGNLDPDVAMAMMGQAEPSQRLVTQQEIADMRATTQEEVARIRTHAVEARALASGNGNFAPTNLQRHFDEASAMGTPYSPEEQKALRDRTLKGGKAKKEALSEEEYLDKQGEYVAKNIRAFMKEEPKGADGKTPMTEDEGILVLQGQFRKMFPRKSSPTESDSEGEWELVTLPDGTSYRRRRK